MFFTQLPEEERRLDGVLLFKPPTFKPAERSSQLLHPACNICSKVHVDVFLKEDKLYPFKIKESL